jgi:hypothetical protein
VGRSWGGGGGDGKGCQIGDEQTFYCILYTVNVIILQDRPKDKQKKIENFCLVFPEHLLLCFLRFIINNVSDCIDSGKAT